MTLRLLLSVLMFTGSLGSVDTSPSEAVYNPQELKAACEQGSTLQCVSLGMLYFNGKEVKQDYLQAETLFRRACDSGDVFGCSALGDMYLTGTGANLTADEAREIVQKSL
jgi:TPR repeat protein